MRQTNNAILALEDGRVFRGRSWAAEGEACGEMVFNTSMSGYQEILTDPSYAGQIVCMTYPEIGNTGTNPEDEESRGIFLSGFVVRATSTSRRTGARASRSTRTSCATTYRASAG